MKTKEYYAQDHTKDITDDRPDPEYDHQTMKMKRLDDEWRKVFIKVKNLLGLDSRPF